MFKLWSESNLDAKKSLKPDLGLREWNSLTEREKYLIWKHLEIHFFNKQETSQWSSNSYQNEKCFDFFDPYSYKKQRSVYISINDMMLEYKAKNYTKNYLEESTVYSACKDFISIYDEGDGNVVLELLSFYCRALIKECKAEFYREKKQEESDTEYEKEKINAQWVYFDEFAKNLNEVFADFGLNIYLTRNSFIPRQDEKILKDIFEPVLQFLSDLKWQEVNQLLSDAFSEYRKNTKESYSTCITHIVSAVQAFLQIIVSGKTGKGDISELIAKAQKNMFIPSDNFTTNIFKPIESLLMRVRQEKGVAHPKQEYATEKDAKLVLNVAMVFFQHCIIN
jgi:hypothetical protein